MPAPFASLGELLSNHRAITRLMVTAILFGGVIAFSQQSPTQAGLKVTPPSPRSLLPETLGIGVVSDASVTINFSEPMDRGSVEAALELVPAADARLRWNDDSTRLTIAPAERWLTEAEYLVVIDGTATTAEGAPIESTRRYAFSTQLAPSVTEFQVRLADADVPEAEIADLELAELRFERTSGSATLTPNETARDVSTSTSIRIGFSDPMDRASAEERFSITPDVAGELSWQGGDLVFSPAERLQPGARYTVSLLGATDTSGNELGGKPNFSFLVRPGPQLVRTTPALGASGVEPVSVEMWFSQPMDVDATNAAFALTDTTTGRLVAGHLNWNEDRTQLIMSPDRPFAPGRTFRVTLGDGASDANGHPIAAEWSFSTGGSYTADVAPREQASSRDAAAATEAAPPPPPPPAPAPAVMGASGLEGYALAQINNARAAYGFPPLALDPAISAVAAAHAWDQLTHGYYSHSSRNGASVHQRLAAGGIGYSAAGENQCHAMMGWGAQGTMDWCHSVFMSEPWPGHWNHIGNILSTRYTRVGVGVADNGSRVVITWNFAN